MIGGREGFFAQHDRVDSPGVCGMAYRGQCRIFARSLVFAVCVSLGAPAGAQAVSTVSQIIAALSQPDKTAPTRSVVRDATGVVLEGLPTAKLIVDFENGTHRLSYSGMMQLRNLAAALQHPNLSGTSFQIAAHSFLPNTPTVSQSVSARRAEAITRHLTTFYRIDPNRLIGVGFGAMQPHSVSNGMDPLNQRIEVMNLGQSEAN